VVYNARTAPLEEHRQALIRYGEAVRHCLEGLVGEKMADRCWQVAQTLVIQGCLGLRRPTRHAAAAYLICLAQTKDVCGLLDPRELSSMVDAAFLEQILATNRRDVAFCAHVALSRMSGAGVWLTVPLVFDGRERSTPLCSKLP
jgi:hypothetical protein